MKNGSWKTVSLFDICSPKQWATIPQKDFVESGYPVFGANGKVGFYTEFNHEHPTILVTCRGATCGTINVCDPKSYVTGNAMALDDLDESRVDLGFLVYALRQNGLSKAITGTAQPQITRTSLKAVRVSFPPLDEQKRIAEVLDRAEALRARRRAALALLDELTQSIFLDMFGDPVINHATDEMAKFKELTTKITYGFTCPMEHLSDGVPIVTAKNVRKGFIDFQNCHYASAAQFNSLTDKCKPELGDLLITKDGAIRGRCALVMTEERFCISQAVALVRPDRSVVTPEYLWGYIASDRIQRKIMEMDKGVAMLHLHITALARFPIALPTKQLQKEYVRRVRAVETLKGALKRSLSEIDALFASLQSRAFKGELLQHSLHT